MKRNDYDYFKSLHNQEKPLMLYNCWDVASAKAIEKAGSKAIATSSFAMAEAWGYSDGEQLSFEQLLWSISAGADGIFIPGLTDRNLIEQFVQKSPLPVNVMVMDGMVSNAELQELGVKRISYGPYSYFQAQHNLQESARTILQSNII
ncbi:isocitrate lyase/phosphoenolpyruvate mutase family protein [Paenibacillus etheri]|uniref:Isocitrate lyase/phosphoenolpyruvate mutase family protein n=1 Tax=Paenibacillus etheri TaxID=1306852 RepID=A0A0W1AUF9_9BACL|nr:isocitrate lyase/phosphoenolpyruvate mutase family protein [Paenibacillus etheri]KTD84935.1 hypothetical protein UQ64_25225 [Paenibacillus etheri]